MKFQTKLKRIDFRRKQQNYKIHTDTKEIFSKNLKLITMIFPVLSLKKTLLQ
jgi:hypothetical protein